MQAKRMVGEKGQVVVPKDMRDHIGIAPGSEVLFEAREGEIVIKPQKSAREFVEEFCNLAKSKKNISTAEMKKMFEEQLVKRHGLR